MEYTKHHGKSLQKGPKADKYIIQNLTWSEVYLRSTFSSAVLQKVLQLLPMTATGPKVYVATMNTVIYDSYASLVETLNHTKSLKLKDHQGENITYFCDAILVDAKHLESTGAFKPEHPSYIIRIFEDTSDSRSHPWVTHKYKEVTEFSKKLFVCDEYVIRPDDIITYGYHVQEAMRKYCSLFDSNEWETTYGKNNSKYEPLLLKASNV